LQPELDAVVLAAQDHRTMLRLLDRLPFRRRTLPAPKRLADQAADAVQGALQTVSREAARVPATAPLLILATGAGVAVWWWTQWARGRAESEANAKDGDGTE
jgi:hypothetical protein